MSDLHDRIIQADAVVEARLNFEQVIGEHNRCVDDPESSAKERQARYAARERGYRLLALAAAREALRIAKERVDALCPRDWDAIFVAGYKHANRLALSEIDDLLSSLGAQEQDQGAALLPVDPSAAVTTETLPKCEHEYGFPIGKPRMAPCRKCGAWKTFDDAPEHYAGLERPRCPTCKNVTTVSQLLQYGSCCFCSEDAPYDSGSGNQATSAERAQTPHRSAAQEQDQGGTSLTAGASVSVSVPTPQLPHDERKRCYFSACINYAAPDSEWCVVHDAVHPELENLK